MTTARRIPWTWLGVAVAVLAGVGLVLMLSHTLASRTGLPLSLCGAPPMNNEDAARAFARVLGLGDGAAGHVSNSSVRFMRALTEQLDRPHDTITFHTDKGKAERQAYAILYMDDDRSHLCGARALIASIRATGSTKDVLALVPPETDAGSRKYLAALGYVVTEVPRIAPNPGRDGYYASVFSALNIWNLDGYDRVVKLDTDMVVLSNIDELFMYSYFAASLDWPAGKPPNWGGCDEAELCVQTWHDWRMTALNGAMYVVQPHKGVFKDMMGVLERHEEKLEGGPSEQGFLNWYFKNRWVALPYQYNIRYAALNFFPQMFTGVAPRTFHYIGGSKPWRAPFDCNAGCRDNPLMLMWNQEWYRFYNMVSDTPETTPPVACLRRLVMS